MEVWPVVHGHRKKTGWRRYLRRWPAPEGMISKMPWPIFVYRGRRRGLSLMSEVGLAGGMSGFAISMWCFRLSPKHLDPPLRAHDLYITNLPRA